MYLTAWLLCRCTMRHAGPAFKDLHPDDGRLAKKPPGERIVAGFRRELESTSAAKTRNCLLTLTSPSYAVLGIRLKVLKRYMTTSL
jgi:hypothetical protein